MDIPLEMLFHLAEDLLFFFSNTKFRKPLVHGRICCQQAVELAMEIEQDPVTDKSLWNREGKYPLVVQAIHAVIGQ